MFIGIRMYTNDFVYVSNMIMIIMVTIVIIMIIRIIMMIIQIYKIRQPVTES